MVDFVGVDGVVVVVFWLVFYIVDLVVVGLVVGVWLEFVE